NVGFSPGASGTISVLGAGSAFGTGGALSIGGNISGPGGMGGLAIDYGGAVSASVLNVWNTGTLGLDHGATINAATTTIDAPVIVGEGGASIEGDLVLTPASQTIVGVAAGSSGLAVSGTAALSGVLTIEFYSAVTPGPYTLIEADGGLGGSTFASVSVTPPADMTAAVTYDDTHVYLVLASTVDDDLVFRDGFDGTP
ncbi:MAG TPA: hypothetical protein VGN65_08340, partial [Casimicrobiaceae bacterium]